MAGKVFISCGQANADERQVAARISAWLASQGFDPYVAIQTQSILEVNTGIIRELKSSDLYLFINFRRERIRKRLLIPSRFDFYRGSVFTNQELAIAFALGFERMIFINQRGVKRDGLFGYIGSNTPEFTDLNEVLPIVQTAIASAGWHPSYSRNLDIRNLRWNGPIPYGDHTGTRTVKGLLVDVANGRPDVGSSTCVARLASITNNGIITPSPDRSHLKCTGFPGYVNVVWPASQVAFDLLSIDMANQSNIFLHSSMDVIPRLPIISTPGTYQLHYEVFAKDFPILEFDIDLNVTGNAATTTARFS